MPPDEPDAIAQNVEAVIALQLATEQRLSRRERAIERVVRVIGRPATVLSIPALVGIWVMANIELGPRAFDPPPFGYLQAVVSIAALVTTAMVLTVQSTQGHREAHRVGRGAPPRPPQRQQPSRLARRSDGEAGGPAHRRVRAGSNARESPRQPRLQAEAHSDLRSSTSSGA